MRDWKIVLGIGLLMTSTLAYAAPSKPRFFVVVHGVDEADGVKSDIVDELKKLFVAELARHPELVTEVPGLAIDPSADPATWKADLHKHGLARALDMSLRVLEVDRSLDPPPEGKPFRILKRGIRLSVFGTTLPDKVMAIGGDGDSVIRAEIRKNEDETVEGNKLLLEAATTAIKQAVDMTITKLQLPPPKDPKAHKKR